MMENYDEIIIDNARTQTLDSLNLNKITDMNDLMHLNEQHQNFNFGAEIITTEVLNVNAKQQQQQQNVILNEIAAEQLKQDQQVLLSVETTNTCSVVEQQQQPQQIAAQIQTNIEIKTNNEIFVDKQTTVQLEKSTYDDKQITRATTTDESSGNIDDEEDDVDDSEAEAATAAQNATTNFQNKMNNIMHQNNSSVEGGMGAASDPNTDETTSDSDFSDISGLSDVSGREWKPISSRPLNWVQKQMHSGADPREILSQILPGSAHQIAPGLNDRTLWRILASMLAEPPRRQKLRYINTFEDVVHLVRQSKNIIVLTGAGVSVSCGIPDFRSSDGIYSRLAKDYPDLPDPQAMFDINYFSRDPRPFYKFAREIYPGQFRPSPCHRFIKLLEEKQKLLRNYTQNIDTLEQVAGIRNVIECHGSFSTASCTKCKHKCDAEAIRADIFAQRIPVCPICQPNVQQSVDASEPVSQFELRQLVENGIMKPDIVFFGEGLPEEFHTVMASDKDKCDLLIVMGSSLKVRPVALIPSSIPPKVPQILINREQLHHLEFDVELLGDSDVIINQLCHCLGTDWKDICYDNTVLQECRELLPMHTVLNSPDDGVDDLHDVDTQSIKSNSSNDLGLRSTGTYSDSGFESSTSSNVANIHLATSTGAGAECLPPELLEGPNEFHTFAERLAPPTTTATPTTPTTCDTYRHYSVDSTKDSGFAQCCGESSNSSALTPTNFGHDHVTSSTTTTMLNQSNMTSAHIIKTTIPTPTASPAESSSAKQVAASSSSQLPKIKHVQVATEKRRLSAAERLPAGCYYCHDSTASYLFPGAQVTWCTDTEGEDDDDENEEEVQRRIAGNQEQHHLSDGDDEKEDTLQEADDTCEDDDEDELSEAVDDESQGYNYAYESEAGDELVMDTITTTETTVGNCNINTSTGTTTTKTCIKRHSNEYTEESTIITTRINAENAPNSTSPPNKKRRDSDSCSTPSSTVAVTPFSTDATPTTNTNTNHSFINKSPQPPETLLQQH